jgi:hypothetical protein
LRAGLLICHSIDVIFGAMFTRPKDFDKPLVFILAACAHAKNLRAFPAGRNRRKPRPTR